MKRKVAKIGPTTLMVSLPAKWARKYNINKGSELELTELGKTLNISTPNEILSHNQITIDASDINERVLRWYISALHKSGYDEIKILYSDNKIIEIVKDLLKSLLIGFALTEQNEKYLQIKQISTEIEQEFDSILRRSFLVTLSLAKQSLEQLKTNSNQITAVLDLENSNNQLTNFCERILNKNTYRIPEKTSFVYVILWNLEKIADDYKYISNIIQEQNIAPSKSVLNLYERVNSLLESYYNLFYKFDIKLLNELSDMGQELVTELKSLSTLENNITLYYLLSLTLKIQDFSTSMIALNHN